MSSNIGVLRKQMELFGNTAGAANDAFEDVSAVRGWQRLWQSVLSIVSRVGEKIDTVLQPAINMISAAIKRMGDSGAFAEFIDQVGEATGKVANLIRVITSGGISQAIKTLGDIIRLSFLDGAERAGGMLARSIQDAYRKFISNMKDGGEKNRLIKIFGAGSVQLSEKARERQGLNETDAGRELKAIFGKKSPASFAGGGRTEKLIAEILGKTPAGKIGTGNMSGGGGIGGISGSTSMLSTGDLFTMMQTGSGAKDSMISEQQKTNEKLDELIKVSGGVV